MSDFITRGELRRVMEAADAAAFNKFNPWGAGLDALDALAAPAAEQQGACLAHECGRIIRALPDREVGE